MSLVSVNVRQRLIERLLALTLLIYPSLMIAMKGGMNSSFALLLLLSVGALIFRPSSMSSIVWDKELAVYFVAMAALPVAIFLSQSYHQNYSAHPYDTASRFFLAVPIFMFLRRVRFDVISMVQYAFPLAAIIGLLVAKELVDGRLLVPFMDLIHFGDFELMLAVLSLLSINWAGRDVLPVRILKIAGFIVGVYVSMKTGSRGGWLALPVFALIYMRYKLGGFSLKSIAATFVIMLVLVSPVYIFNSFIHDRVNEAGHDLVEFKNGNLDTDTGIRLQLYKAAIIIFLDHPVFGVGPEGFKTEMAPMVQSGRITSAAAKLGRGEVHNELLSKAAGLGVFGLIAILLIYLVPLRIFYRAMRSGLGQVRQAGMLGLIFVSGFMVFGLTVEVLNLTMATAFYSLTVAVLAAATTSRVSADAEVKG